MQTFSVRRVVSAVDRTWENIYPTFSSSMGSTLWLIEKATHDALYLWDISPRFRPLPGGEICGIAAISSRGGGVGDGEGLEDSKR
jgi:hypothetical protein